MPMKRELYPVDWEEIAAKLKDEVGQKCEECGVPNHEWIHRRLDNPAVWISALDEAGEAEWYWNVEQYTEEPIQVILTTAHLDHDPSHNDRSNLRVLCQRCHLVYDSSHHVQNARRTRILKKHQIKSEAGQLGLFEGKVE